MKTRIIRIALLTIFLWLAGRLFNSPTLDIYWAIMAAILNEVTMFWLFKNKPAGGENKQINEMNK